MSWTETRLLLLMPIHADLSSAGRGCRGWRAAPHFTSQTTQTPTLNNNSPSQPTSPILHSTPSPHLMEIGPSLSQRALPSPSSGVDGASGSSAASRNVWKVPTQEEVEAINQQNRFNQLLAQQQQQQQDSALDKKGKRALLPLLGSCLIQP